jgi:phytoene desaturase
MKKSVTIIGSGISSLSSACYLAKAGFDVTIVEKNNTIGGRARKFSEQGFTFDMGPSWYWMPDVFDKFFNDFGYKSQDFYELIRLDPSYRIFWEDEQPTDLPANYEELRTLFEQLEKGSSAKLDKFLEEAKYKYDIGINELVRKPSLKMTEFADFRILKGVFNMHLFSSFSKHIRQYFKHPKILSILEFPVLFLGAMPEDTPALYSLMNYADIKLGTWYPMGGMHKFIEAFEKIALSLGVKIETNAEIKGMEYSNRTVKHLKTNDKEYTSDVFVSGADYAHTDFKLLSDKANYTKKYWSKRTMAPSSLIFYVGVDKKLEGICHHNLFFDESLQQHGKEIYKTTEWPSAPLFYMCAPSLTDSSVAPAGMENLFFLIPIAPDLEDSEEIREKYFKILLSRLKQKTGNDIENNIVFKKSYCIEDFKKDYHAFKGNAYGLANTLKQTAIFKPKLKNKHLDNFYYTGQLTVPGPGVPPSIISGEVVANEIIKNFKTKNI